MKRYYSGSGSSGAPIGSLGGAINSNEVGNAVVNAMWDDVTTDEASAGDTEYRCFYFKWLGADTISNVVMFLSSKAHGPQDSVFIGKGTSAKNGVEQTIANETANPVGVSFDNPGSRATAITIASTMAQNEWQAVWLKRTIDQGAGVLNLEDYEIEVQFDPPGGGGSSPPPTPPPGGDVGTYEIAFGGDTDCGGDYTKNITNIKYRGCKLYFPLGDYSYDDTATCWLSDTDPLKSIIKALVMGNHEVEEGVPSGLKTTYLNWIGQANQWASVVYRNQHYLILSEFASYGVGSAQYNFALQKLQQYANDPNIDWRFVLFHEPMYTNPAHHDIDDDGDGAFRDIYHPLFDQYNVDVMFSGHNHDFQRSYPLTYNGGTNPTKADTATDNYVSPFAGEIQVICGTLGKDIYTISSQSTYFVTDGSSKFEQHGYGILEFSNSDKMLKIKFYNVNNVLIDECTITKSAGIYDHEPYGVFRSSNYITVPHSSTLNLNQMTVACWFRTSKDYTADQAGYMLAKGEFADVVQADNLNYMLLVSCDVIPNNRLEFNWETLNGNEHYVFSDVPVNDGIWHLAVGTFDGTNTKVYLDGVLHDSANHAGQTPNNNTYPLYIGQYGPGFTTYEGDVDEVRLWNRTLSQQEITDLYHGIVATNGLVYENTFGGS